MKKIKTFYRYFCDFIKHGEYRFIFSSFKYILFKIPSGRTCIVKSQVGYFLSRKGTIDFQFANYAYEWNVKSFVLENFKNYNVFFDVGANIGTYCILLAKKGLRCFGFEPIKDNYQAFQVNVLLNDLEDRINVLRYGLGKKERIADFIYNTVNTGASHLFQPPDENDGMHEDVYIKSLDSVYESFGLDINDKILIKVDVEGMEENVFLGAIEFLKTFPNLLIIFENKHSNLQKIKEIFAEIAKFEYMKIDHYNMALKKVNQ